MGGFFFEGGAMSVLIFANGEMPNVAWTRPFLHQAALIIAADGGSKHLYRLRSRPDVVIGDMDSASPEIVSWLQALDVPMIKHDPVKDETDLELALLYAREHSEEIFLFGTLGGRMDQMLANVLLLAHPALSGASVQIVEEFERAWLIEGRSQFSGEPGDTVSLIPLDRDVIVKETVGLRWQLTNSVLAYGMARGVSNEMTAVSAVVEVASGKLLCIHSLDHKKE